MTEDRRYAHPMVTIWARPATRDTVKILAAHAGMTMADFLAQVVDEWARAHRGPARWRR